MVKTITVLAYMLGHIHPAYIPFQIQSAAIKHEHIARVYTCKGRNKLIPIAWQGVPKGTRSLTLIMYDIDAPGGEKYHWVVYNIPPTLHHLNLTELSKAHAQEGLNSWGHLTYDGPCPLQGDHRYILQLYAVDERLHLSSKEKPTAPVVEAHMRGHIISQTDTMGVFGKAVSYSTAPFSRKLTR